MVKRDQLRKDQRRSYPVRLISGTTPESLWGAIDAGRITGDDVISLLYDRHTMKVRYIGHTPNGCLVPIDDTPKDVKDKYVGAMRRPRMDFMLWAVDPENTKKTNAARNEGAHTYSGFEHTPVAEGGIDCI